MATVPPPCVMAVSGATVSIPKASPLTTVTPCETSISRVRRANSSS